MTLLTQSTPREAVARLAGNKGQSLYSLGALGIAVPAWAILGIDVCSSFLEAQGLEAVVRELLLDLSPDRIESSAKEIQDRVLAAEIGADIRMEIDAALAQLGEGPIAVRSSGIEEDRADYSFAGQFETFLHIEGLEAVIAHVKKCWASLYSPRALGYRHSHRLGLPASGMAVILQRMVPANKSGVVFTCNPATSNPNEIVISSVYGLGEGLVSGAVDADTLVVERQSGRIADTVIGEKQQRYTGAGRLDVASDLRGRLSLEPSEIVQIRVLAERIEAAFGGTQDIEWCFEDRTLWVLQARPVTSAAKAGPDSGDFQIWDNSNIIENYPGVSSQLTFTFAQHVYFRVFREFCRLLGIPGMQLREMDSFLCSMLGYLNGRIYYNLLHWYKLSGLAPFQKLSRQMMEIQMGVGERLDQEAFAAKIQSYTTRSRLEHGYIRFRIITSFVWDFLTLERNVARFTRFFARVFRRFDALDFRAMPAETVYAHYLRFERELLERWGRMVSLESAIALSYGLLRALIRRWIKDAPDWFEVAVIGGIDDMESMKPALEMAGLARKARARPKLFELIGRTPSREAYSALRDAGELDFLAAVDRYIDAFGYRSKNELKLEEPDLHEAPEIFFDMLKTVLASEPQRAAAEAPYAERVEALLRRHLNLWQRFFFGLARRRARNAIRARETVRFCRSRAFGVSRRMFLAIGAGMKAQGVLDQERDIFHLRLDEIRGCFEGTVSHREIKPLVAQRRADYDAYRAMQELPPRFVTRGAVAAWLADPENLRRLHKPEASAAESSRELRGIPCSPGIAEGKARVVCEANEFDAGILVTYRTDPGWIPVFPAATAILVERGSPLTHAAIVAREFGVPTIVQIPGLTKRVANGMTLRADGHTGRITILEEAGPGKA